MSVDSGNTGFWFFGAEQFDVSNRYALAMMVYFKDRNVTKDDVADIGYFDLRQGNQWTKIGTTTAWNWQQGCRLQWRLNSDEIAWNDRADDNSHCITKLYNFKTKAPRTLPRPIYHISPDGKWATSEGFQRMAWGDATTSASRTPGRTRILRLAPASGSWTWTRARASSS